MTDTDIITLLQTTTLFRNVPREMLSIHLGEISRKSFAAEETLLAPGQKNHRVYLIVSGRLRIHLDLSHSIPLTIFGPGECVGEMSILDDAKVSAYVIADTPCELLAIDHAAVWSLIDNSLDAARNLLHIMSRRMRLNNQLFIDNIKRQQTFEHYANVDELTGLHNRRWMNDMFEQQMQHCVLNHEPGTFIMIDADHFKQFNDQHGHLGGDQALRTIAQTMLRSLRPQDFAARYGGEEFAIFLPRTQLEDAYSIADRLRMQINQAAIVMPSGNTLPSVTISLGLSEICAEDTLERLIARADAALYRAKQAGRNCVCH
jgi:diguanylate cyclase (GGDEF)-like protein